MPPIPPRFSSNQQPKTKSEFNTSRSESVKYFLSFLKEIKNDNASSELIFSTFILCSLKLMRVHALRGTTLLNRAFSHSLSSGLMNILFLTPYLASWTKQEILILKEIGHIVHFLYTYEYGSTKYPRHIVIQYFTNLIATVKMGIRAVPLCLKSDLIYCWFVFPTGVLAVALGKLLKRAVILNAVGSDVACLPSINYGAVLKRYYKPLISWTLRNATEVISISQDSAHWARKWSARHVSVVYEGIDTEKFKPSHRKKQEEKREFLLLTVSPLEKKAILRKDLKSLLEALDEVVKKFANVRLMIVGKKGNGYRIIRCVAKDLKLDKQVFYTDYIPHNELVELYQRCDIFVLPSLHEGFPTVCAEAQACGRPVITTNVSSIPEVIENMKSGVLVNVESPRELASAIVQLLSDENLRLRMGKYGRKLIATKFSKDIRRERMRTVLKAFSFRVCTQVEDDCRRRMA